MRGDQTHFTFDSASTPTSTNADVLPIIVVIIVIGLAGWLSWFISAPRNITGIAGGTYGGSGDGDCAQGVPRVTVRVPQNRVTKL